MNWKKFLIFAFLFCSSALSSNNQISLNEPFQEDPSILVVLENLTNAINRFDDTVSKIEHGYDLPIVLSGLLGVVATGSFIGGVTSGIIVSCYLRRLVSKQNLFYEPIYSA